MNPIGHLRGYEPAERPVKERRPPLSDDVKFGLMVLIGFVFAVTGGIAGCAISNVGPSDAELCYERGGNWTWLPEGDDDYTASKTCVLPTEE